MKQIYLNYASTSPSQSPAVVAQLTAHLQNGGYLSAGRNFDGLEDSLTALRARKALAGLFGAPSPVHVAFTGGVTASLNMVLNGLVQPGCHVLASGLEHNAVARVLHRLQKQGVIEVTWLPAAPDGTLDPALVAANVHKNTRLLALTHASNVLGTILPVEECFAAAKRHGLFTVLDAAQTAGVLPVRLTEHTDIVAFTGHKGLRALAGSGGFAMGTEAASAMEPWLVGGTGSASDLLDQPTFLPDKFEPGTPNTIGILSLAASVEEITPKVADIRQAETALTRRFLDGAKTIRNLQIYGTQNTETSVAVVSVEVPGVDSGVLARRLYEEHGIITRSGLHCSPLAHKTAGTFPRGTVRFSFGPETAPEEVDTALAALAALAAE